ncbi:MAG TPA: phage tail protein, partial [Alphaproteobacteria bacterium]|nr:phage tail protein [Alphaproteobacteria bacterium]
LAGGEAQREAQNIILWLDAVKSLGPQALAAVDQAAAARRLGRAFGVPGELIIERNPLDPPGGMDGEYANENINA